LICRLCLKEKRLGKAHVIPEGFFRNVGYLSETLELHTNTAGTYPKRAPIGVYDKSILCSPCDNLFSPWENHAQDVLLRTFASAIVLKHENGVVGWVINSFDYRAMKLFFISLLWRASISTHDFYRRISMGPFEHELREMILAEEPGSPETFAVTLARFSEPGCTAMLDPHPERYDGVNYARFYLSGFVAYIKFDHRPPPDWLADFILRPNAPLTILLRSARESADAVVMRDIARFAWNRKHGG